MGWVSFTQEGKGGRRKEQNVQTQCNVAIAILVVLFKHVRHALEADARLHEEIKTHGVCAAAVVGAVQQRDKLLGEAVAKGDEGVVEFGKRDAAAVVLVEAVEEAAPG